MTVLDHPSTAPPGAGPLAAALALAGPLGALLVLSLAEPTPAATTAVRTALQRETRAEDWVGALADGDELAVVLAVPPADLDAVVDRLLSVAERVGGAAAGGVCTAVAGRCAEELLVRARAGLRVAWACGGSRVVRHP
ncbi:hypothetical protein TEK04_14055 [Klenkia sp. LSe6-5]|uniref:GGDEF domain-containing protein, diguanylate cyclase (C-di-GMP synthetase) or its enzymatically inactive variants n=1 Tax=Klenkia sesuvii TaxID=3103137 RepID=A0ABU8DW46_9ACTN